MVAATSCASEKQAAPPATPPTLPRSGRQRGRRSAAAGCGLAVRRPPGRHARAPSSTPFTGDLDEMVKRRVIRVGVTFNRTHYFIDKGQQRGLAYESIKLFEDDLNADLKTGNLKVHVAAVPLSRDQLASALLNGKVDLVAAMLTVTPERRGARGLLGADADQRERSRGHRARRAADRDGGRPGRPGGVRPRSRASMPRASPR